MRRTEIKRYTKLKPSTKPLKRSPINRISDDKRKFERTVAPLHREYRKLFPKCQRCNRRPGKDIHEILAGSHRKPARARRSCILRLCRDCHEIVQYWPRPKQLALKLWSDPQGYDLLEVNEVLGCPTAVEQYEVDAYLPEVH